MIIATPPEPAQCAAQAKGGVGPRLQRPIEGRAQIVEFRFKPIQSRARVGSTQLRLTLVRKAQGPVQVAVTRILGLAGCFESFAGILTDGLQQPVAHGSAVLLADHQRFVDQRREQIEYGARRNSVAGRRYLGGLEGPAAGEHRQAPQHRPLGLRQ